MSLHFARVQLKFILLYKDPLARANKRSTLNWIETWWGLYKEWEEQDTFLAAMREKRLSVRQGPESQTIKDISMRSASEGPKAAKTKYEGYNYETGLDSVKLRLDPKSFDKTTEGERGKYKLGLHDLSASLLDPAKPKLNEQVRWKFEGGKLDKWVAIFMPVAHPGDLVVFNLLNSMGKQCRGTHPEVYDRIVEIRRRMTRIKLAEENDMGCGFVDVKKNDSPIPKFRYGLSEVSTTTPITYTPGISKVRLAKAQEYTSILEAQRAKGSTSNEIVVAYRQHAGTRFPLFAKWDKEADGFVCLADEPSSASIKGGVIPNDWKQTQQL